MKRYIRVFIDGSESYTDDFDLFLETLAGTSSRILQGYRVAEFIGPYEIKPLQLDRTWLEACELKGAAND